MLKCKQASFLVSQSLDRQLTLSERLQLRFHLMICDACTRFSVQLNQLYSSMRSVVRNIEQDARLELSAEARARITLAIKSDQHQ
jgi:putative zinc finger protein